MGVFTGGRYGIEQLLKEPYIPLKKDIRPFWCTIGTCKERFHHKKDLKAHKEKRHVY